MTKKTTRVSSHKNEQKSEEHAFSLSVLIDHKIAETVTGETALSCVEKIKTVPKTKSVITLATAGKQAQVLLFVPAFRRYFRTGGIAKLALAKRLALGLK